MKSGANVETLCVSKMSTVNANGEIAEEVKNGKRNFGFLLDFSAVMYYN